MPQSIISIAMPLPVYICGYSLRVGASNSAAELSDNLRNKVNAVQSNSKRFPEDQFQVPKFATLAQDITHLDHTFFGINGGQAEKIDQQV
jgi:acyl transferase domain-containing protein